MLIVYSLFLWLIVFVILSIAYHYDDPDMFDVIENPETENVLLCFFNFSENGHQIFIPINTHPYITDAAYTDTVTFGDYSTTTSEYLKKIASQLDSTETINKVLIDSTTLEMPFYIVPFIDDSFIQGVELECGHFNFYSIDENGNHVSLSIMEEANKFSDYDRYERLTVLEKSLLLPDKKDRLNKENLISVIKTNVDKIKTALSEIENLIVK
jgi:hypothetical protein